jgi:hypothetical protein
MATISVLVDAKVAGLGEIGAADAAVQKLGTSTTGLGANLDSTTGKLNASGAAHAAVAKEAQALEGSLAKTTSQVDVAGAAHARAATATQGLGTQLAGVGTQAQLAGTQTEALGTKLKTLESSTSLLGGVAAGTSVAVQDLAAATTKSGEAAAATIDPLAASTTAITGLAAVDATMGAKKKATTVIIEEESGALEKAKAAHEAHAEAIKKGIAATGEFGEAGVKASEKLGVLSGILGGAGGISVGLAAFVVGAGAALAIGKTSIETFNSLGESVLKYQRVTGDSAEQSSRMVSAFTQMGIGGDGAANAMFNLNKKVEGLDGALTKSGKSLAQVGVEIAKNKDGSTDLDKTLANVADAYAGAGSAAEKDTIATTAFGKSAKDMIPLLEQGSAGLHQMASEAQQLFTQQQLEQVHQYTVATTRLGQETSTLGMTIGSTLVANFGPLITDTNDLVAGYNQAEQHTKSVTSLSDQLGISWIKSAVAGVGMSDAGRKSAEAAAEESKRIQQLNTDLRDEEKNRQDLLTADNSSLTASFNLQRAAQGVLNAQKTLGDETVKDAEYADKHKAAMDRVAVAQTNLTAATKAHGPASAQAKTAQDALNSAVDASTNLDRQNADAATRLAGEELNLKEAMLRDSEAAVKAAEATAALGGGHLSAADKAGVQAAELEKLKAAAGGVLPAELQTLLDKLNNFHDVTSTVTIRLNDQTGGMKSSTGTLVTSAEGGIFTRPTMTMVGEAGPEAVIPLRPGNTMPGASPLPVGAAAPAAPTRIYHITQNIQTIDARAAADAAVARFRELDQLYA